MTRSELDWRLLGEAVLVVALGVLPPFLVGSLSVPISHDLGMGPSRLGIVVATYFSVAALTSPSCGRLVERVGTTAGLRIASTGLTLSMFGAGVATGAWWHLLGWLVVGAVSQSIGQLAANALLAVRVPTDRWGVAFGAKQSAIPAATMFAGLAVPAIGLTVGWRWAFIIGAAVAALAAMRVGRRWGDAAPGPVLATRRPMPMRQGGLLIAAVAFGLGNFAANALGVFLVPYGVSIGLSPSLAGVMLSLGSVAGICTRTGMGVWSDRRGSFAFSTVAIMMLTGSLAFAALAGAPAGVLVALTLVAFSAGWGWNGLFIRAIVHSHPHSPAIASAKAQAGGLLGAAAGPLVFGIVTESVGYRAAWGVAAGTAATASGLALLAGRSLSTLQEVSAP